MFDIDFSFDFTRRSPSPSKLDSTSGSALQSPPSSLSPPSSSNDSVSQDGRGGSPHWGGQAEGGDSSWNTQSNDIGDFADAVWNWTQVMPSQTQPVIAHIDEQYPMAIDPAALSYYNGLGANLLGSQQCFIPTHPIDLFPLPTNPAFAIGRQLHPHPSHQHTIPLSTPLAEAQAIISPIAYGSSADDRDLVARVMEAAGIQVAVTSSDVHNVMSLSQIPPNLTVPRLSKPDLAACPPLAKHAMRSPSASAGESQVDDAPTEQAPIGISGRPKTSHTTIERRYRTNLNARILALRLAVPALRILDKDHSQRPEFSGDVVDGRGFVDGVKAARKASKASILGKAAEYIHVLKKRESRLRHEAAGLRALLGTLVGGDALLREFDKNWKARYGGEETDEVAATSDGEDGDEDVSEDEDVKPRKRAKNVKDPVILDKSIPAASNGENGKRKRGRPKKVQPTQDDSNSADLVQMIPPSFAPATHDTGNVQYLLGVFLFFSLFKPSSDPTSWAAPDVHRPIHDHHKHLGSVVTPRTSNPAHTASLSGDSSNWTYFAHNAHTVLSILLLLSVVLPMISLPRCFTFWRRTNPSTSRKDHIKGILESELGDDLEVEEHTLRTGLDVGSVAGEFIKILRCAVRQGKSCDLAERENEVKACWRLANVTLILGHSLSIRNRISTIFGLYRILPSTTLSLSTLSLLFLPVSESLAELIWTWAQTAPSRHAPDDAAMTVMRLSVHEAWSLFSLSAHQRLAATDIDQPPISHAAHVIVVQTISSLAEGVFVREAERLQSKSGYIGPSLGSDIDEATRRVTEISKEMKGAGSALVQRWLDVQNGSFPNKQDEGVISPLVADAGDLVDALGWLRCVILMANPSRDSSNLRRSAMAGILPPALRLRQALASTVFSSSDALEDARDIVIDHLYSK
ncbi:hypothetical protein FRB95_014302 [Tulasnella sp. JGI-2019a]|nr:hypothetical protein FRB93_002738 [Tulasnella sp. JGI-2019a]KAG9038753.1 hypothetical protein FRB95_014302 [Tulasnella sp. JGI-2019a]